MDSIQFPIRLNSLSPALVQETLVIISISSQPSTTGLMKTESTTNTNLTSEELNFTHWALYIMPVCSTSPDSTQSEPLAEWTDGLVMTEILTCKSIFPNYHLPKQSKSSGTELQSLSEDLPNNKSSKKTNTQLKQFWTRALKLFWPQPVRAAFWFVQLSALIWVAFQSHIWETTTDGFAFVTVQYTTSSEESDKDPLCKTCHILITQFTRMEHWFVSKHSNSQENHLSDSGLDFVLFLNQLFYIYSFSIFKSQFPHSRRYSIESFCIWYFEYITFFASNLNIYFSIQEENIDQRKNEQ